MGEVDVVGAFLTATMMLIALWFYRHCARPALAFAGAPRTAFNVVLLCLAGSLAVNAGLLAESVLGVLPRGAGRLLAACGMAFWVPLAVAFLRPTWFTRLGGRDASAPIRFLLTWLRNEWASLESTTLQGPGLLHVAEAELEKVREPANALLVDEWVALFATYRRKSRLGSVSAQSAEHHLAERLAEVQPVDRLTRTFNV